MKKFPLQTLSTLTIAGLFLIGPVQAFDNPLTPEDTRGLTEAREMEAITLYRDLLSLPNDANNPEDILRLADWLEEAFAARGFETRKLETAGSPVVFAEMRIEGAERTALVYLQADGQPVDPTAWFQDNPYVPVLKEPAGEGSFEEIPWSSLEGGINPDWRIFARSASDSKGPIAQFLMAMDNLAAAGVTPGYNLKVIMDTEEELGSPNLAPAIERYKDVLAADFLLIFDGPPHASNAPTLKFGNRGIATITLVTYGPRVPQHSGHYGNYAPNPAFHMSRILASMKSADGRVVIPGFYDGVEIDAETRAILDAVPDDEEEIRKHLGIAKPDAVGETLQLAVQYPSLNIRGLNSAWVGAAARTIVPGTATAEIDVRLVKESDPERLVGLIRGHIEDLGYYVIDREPTEEERLTRSGIVNFTYDVNYGAVRTDFSSEPGQIARAAMNHLYGSDPILIRTSGGSVPISPFVETLDVPTVGVPTVNIDNNQHSPNENLRLGNFIEGISIITAVLAERP